MALREAESDCELETVDEYEVLTTFDMLRLSDLEVERLALLALDWVTEADVSKEFVVDDESV